MATMNPFDLLGDDDNDDPSLLIAKVEKEKPKAAPPAAAAAAAAPAQQGKLGAKSLNPSQAARESRNEGGRGGGGSRGAGRFGRGGRGGGGFNRESNNNEGGFGNSQGYGYKPSEDGESGRTTERRSYGAPRGGGGAVVGGSRRRGGLSNGEAAGGEGERPRRAYERRSGTGRGSEVKREGSGRGNWGNASDDVAPGTEEPVAENEGNAASAEKQPVEEEAADANKDNPAKESEEKEPEEDKEMTLEEYEKVLEEKRKALLALKTEERKVDAKAFESMQQLSSKKENSEIFAKLGSDKDKKKETAAEREERVKKAVSINEFLKPAEGENPYRGGGRGGRGGRGRGDRGGRLGGGYGGGGGFNRDVSAPSIEDPGQFPSLGGK